MIKLYNTLTKSKEEFKPIKDGEVGIYSCGPTVYNFVHIGNLRAYLFADILHRTFLYNGFKVNHVMNITDVDDKTIRDSQAAGLSLKEFTEKYTRSFFEDLEKLNINKGEYIFPHATENIDGMVKLIKKLLDKEYAYKAEDGSIYFTISKFKDYGKLSGVDFERDSQSRVANDEYAKEEAHDFALWKAWDEKDGDVVWDPKDFGVEDFGKGRPGWHIECSVMSSSSLGQPFDIHTGGIDLIFPHHENEIAQSEAANDKKFVNYWIHNEMLMVDGQKMSKSLNNVYTLQDIGKKGETLAFRYLCLGTHYRQKLNFTWESFESALNAYKNLHRYYFGKKVGESGCEKYEKEFLEAINDDFNTPKALAVVWEMTKDDDFSDEQKAKSLIKFDKALGLELEFEVKKTIPQKIINLANERQEAKNQKDFAKADKIRGKIEKEGYAIEDLPEGKYKIILNINK